MSLNWNWNDKMGEVSDYHWASFKLDTNYKETAKFIKALADAKAEITIELYNGKEK